jgi:cell wall-associated NlpC family hydrolase
MAAAVTFQALIASAAPVVSSRPRVLSTPLRIEQPHSRDMQAAGKHTGARRLRAYAWARRQVGHPYVWGGTGPGFDCSGLVMMAYLHAGVHLPRTTTEMLASPLLVRVVHPRMGDLAFYGSYHVELFRRWGYTFGAHDSGSAVGLIHYGWGWQPTAFYRVVSHRRG